VGDTGIEPVTSTVSRLSEDSSHLPFSEKAQLRGFRSTPLRDVESRSRK